MKLGVEIDLDDLSLDLKAQGHRSKVKVTKSENMIFGSLQLFKQLSEG